MARSTKARRAFTLVELLVVIAIIGILVALMLPAVQMARETGRRANCISNVHNLCIAMQSYHTAHRNFPINWGTGSDPGTSAADETTKGHSWITYLLPHLEEKPLYDSIKLGQAINFSDTQSNNKAAAMRPIGILKCPSDTHDGTLKNQLFSSNAAVAVTNYKACSGANWNGTSSGLYKYKKKDGMKDSAGVMKTFFGRNADSYDGRDKGDGVICRGLGSPNGGAIMTSDFEVRDGMSKTFACGESVPEYCAWSSWYWFNGATATCAMPPNHEEQGKKRRDNSTDWQSNWGFHSRHPGGVSFGLCDGSTQFINNDIDLFVYRAYATIDGGEIAQMVD